APRGRPPAPPAGRARAAPRRGRARVAWRRRRRRDRLVTVDRSEILGIIDRQGSLTPCRIICVSWLGQIVAGCRTARRAVPWAHDGGIDQFSAMPATPAPRAGVRYLELNGAFNAHEVCAAGA